MNGEKEHTKHAASRSSFQSMALQDLIACIARNGEKGALEELLERRPLFRRGEESRLLLPDYILALWRRPPYRCAGDPTNVLDNAYDITLDKFARFSQASAGTEAARNAGRPLKQSGPDCRYYYKAFLEMVRKSGIESACAGAIELECGLGRLLQMFVTRHFHLSLLEARRSANPMVSRYVWRLNGKGAITLWLPKAIRGRERRKWLEKNVAEPDTSRPGERERVQAIVDACLARGGLVPFHRFERTLSCRAARQKQDWAPSLPEKGAVDLAQFIAREKADSIDLQRPAVRALGPANLRDLVLAVFENTAEKRRSEEELAETFGLSKAAFSRFAGSRWDHAVRDKKGTIPDLWLNVAQVLARDLRFTDVARRAGVFRAARGMAQENTHVRLRTGAHE